MTTIETLTVEQITSLSTNAAQAGDAATVADCELLYNAYLDSDHAELSALIDAERGEVRDAARRIVAVISDGEAAADDEPAIACRDYDRGAVAARRDR